MQCEKIWKAVDKLAVSQGLSVSSLAKKSGLDATTFNKSKRMRNNKYRWPSLDSISRLLDVCNLSFDQFYDMGCDGAMPEIKTTIPYIRYSGLSRQQHIKDTRLKTESWPRKSFIDVHSDTYAVLLDEGNFAPIYRPGTTLIITQTVNIRNGDRLIMYLNDGQIIIKDFVQRTPSSIIVADLAHPEQQSDIPLKKIRLVNRVLWASQ